MNFSTDMIPGICVLLCGALMTFFADYLCRRKQSVPTVRMIGTLMAFLGTILIFVP